MLLLLKLGIVICFGLLFFMFIFYANHYILKKRKEAETKKKDLLKISEEEYSDYKQKEDEKNIEKEIKNLSEKAKLKYLTFHEIFPKFNYQKYRLLKFLCAIISGFLLTMVLGPAFGIVGMFLCWFLPDTIAKRFSQKKLNRFELQLVDGLTLVANALKSGASFSQAVEVMVKETKEPISGYFAQYLKENRMGASVENALDNLASRIKSEELKIAVVSINIARQAGGNLSEILLHIANTIRERERIKGKIDSLTAQGKLSGYVISILPVFLLAAIYKIDPLMVQPLFQTLLGNLILIFAGLMILVGSYWIKKIVKINF